METAQERDARDRPVQHDGRGCREAGQPELQFLHWFIEEQVEEERTMRALIDLVDSGINLFQAEAHIESVVRA